jgi:RecB family endonuclease NucS
MAMVKVSYNLPTDARDAVDQLAARRNQERQHVVRCAVLLDARLQRELDDGAVLLIQRPDKHDPGKVTISQLDLVHVM